MRYRRFAVHCLVILGLIAAKAAASQSQNEIYPSTELKKVGFLVAPGTRRELIETASQLVEIRHKTNPHGYEKDFSFVSNFRAMRERLEKALASDVTSIRSSAEIVEGLTSALEAYSANLQDFGLFYAAYIGKEKGSDLGSKPASRIAADLLTLYLLAEVTDPQLASHLKKGSFIWPFCLTQNRAATSIEPGMPAYILLGQLKQLKKEGYSIPFMIEIVHRLKLGEGFSSSEVLDWRAEGIPDEVIRAILEKLASSR